MKLIHETMIFYCRVRFVNFVSDAREPPNRNGHTPFAVKRKKTRGGFVEISSTLGFRRVMI